MAKPVTMFTAQWTDMPINVLADKAASWGYDGLELACWGDHLNVEKGAKDLAYCEQHKAMLAKKGIKVWAISNHLVGQLVCDPNNDCRSDIFAPAKYAGDADGKRKWAVEQMKLTAIAAKNMGVKVVNGFTGSPIWHMFYSFPPVSDQMIADGFGYFAEMWNPILDVFRENGIKFALEVHPTEIAFDTVTTARAINAVGHRPEFGINFDPSHLYWQFVDPAHFIREFSDRIYHVHMKDANRTLDGRSGILSSHLNFGQPGRGWDFRSLGHGNINFEEIIRELNRAGYSGPLSVEWEDCGMEREYGAKEACAFVKKYNFSSSDRVFDAAFDDK